MKNKFNELIIGSGGVNGLCYIGALEIINEYYPLKNFTYLTGCSVGSLICFLLNIGYSINAIKNIAFEINFDQFYELKLINLMNSGGFVDHTKIKNLVISFISIKNLQYNITFKELFNKTGINLTINGVNLSHFKCEYFNYITSPDMSCLDAVLISMNIPLLCSPYKYEDKQYIDGAVLDPFPYNYHKNTNKLNLIVYSNNEKKFIFENIDNNDIEKQNTILNTFFLIYYNYLKLFYKKNIKNTIYITNNPVYNFKLCTEDKKKLLSNGIENANRFFKRIFNKNKKHYLIKKYFHLLKFLIKNHV